MKKLRKTHYWIGVIASLFLFIESVSGIYLYFQEQGRGNMEGNRQAFFQQQQSNFQNQQGSNSNASDNSNSAGQNWTSSYNGQNRLRGQMNFNRQGSMNSLGMTIRKLHSGIVGLIAGMGMFIMTATGLILSIIIGKASWNRKKKAAAA